MLTDFKAGGVFSPFSLFSGILLVAACFHCAAVAAETCGVMAGPNSSAITIADLKISQLKANQTLPVPTVAQGKVSALFCRRDSLVPAEYDYKTLQAGLPFVIIAHGTSLWLEIKAGKLAVSFKDGQLTPSEAEAIQTWVNQVQPLFYKQNDDKS